MSQFPDSPEDRPATAADEAPPAPQLEPAEIDFDAALGEALAAVERHTRKPEEPGKPEEPSEPIAPADEAELAQLRRDLQEARREVARCKAELARAHDDLSSLRRLNQRQEADLPQQAVRRLLVDLLPALDHVDTLCRYMLAKPELPAGDRQALEMLDAEWQRAQQRLQLEPYDAVGQALDTQRHEVIASLSDATQPPGVVLRQAGRGYVWNGKLLRMAQVVVNAQRPLGPR